MAAVCIARVLATSEIDWLSDGLSDLRTYTSQLAYKECLTKIDPILPILGLVLLCKYVASTSPLLESKDVLKNLES